MNSDRNNNKRIDNLLIQYGKVFSRSFSHYLMLLLSFLIINSSLYPHGSSCKFKVLYINSYHKGYIWSDQITAGIENTLLKSGDVELSIEYLDSKRHPDTLFYKNIAYYFKALHKRNKFDAIITSDDDAFNFAIKYGKDIFGNTPITFSGTNYLDTERLQGLNNFTGVNEQGDIKKNVELIGLLHPNATEIIVITDNTTTGKRIQEEVKKVKQLVKFPHIKLIYDVTAEELSDTLSKTKINSVVLHTFFFKDRKERFFEYDEGARLVSNNCTVPVYGVWSFSLGYGIVGGWLTDGYFQGEEAAKITLQVLSGIKPAKIPIMMETPAKLCFDYNYLVKYNIQLSDVPKNAYIINNPVTFYDQYKQYVWTVIIIIVFLLLAILGISFGYFRSHQIAKTLFLSKESLRTTLYSIGEAVISTDVLGRITQMNHVAETLTGWSFKDAEGKYLHEVFNIVDPVTREVMKNPVEKVIESGKVVGLANHTMLISRNSDTYQIADTAAAIKDETGNITGIVLVFRNVTEECKIREVLKESEIRFRDMAEMLPEIIFETDLQLNVTYGNRRAYEHFGFKDEDFKKGVNIFDLLDEADKDRAKHNYYRRMNNEDVGLVEYNAKRKDGSSFPILIHFNHFKKNDEITGFRGIIIDITRQKQNESQIKRRLEFEELLFRSSYKLIDSNESEWDETIIYILECVGKFSDARRAYLYRYSQEENIFYDPIEWIAPGEIPSIELKKKVNATLIPNVTEYLKNSNGLNTKTAEALLEEWKDEKEFFKAHSVDNLMVIPISASRRLLGVLGIESIYEKESTDNEFSKLLGTLGSVVGAIIHRNDQHRALNKAKVLAETSDRLKSEFLAQMSHEIRTPINGIFGYTDLIQITLEEKDYDNAAHWVNQLKKSSGRLIRTVELIIAMSELTANCYYPSFKNILLAGVLKKVFNKFKKDFNHKGLQFELNNNFQDVFVKADEDSLVQILDNVFDNALKYTSQGKVNVTVSMQEDIPVVYVEDTGIGISAEYMKKLFTPSARKSRVIHAVLMA